MGYYTGKVSLSGPGTFSVKNKNGQTIHSGVQEVTFTNYPLPITITCTNKIYGATSPVSIMGDKTAQITYGASEDAKIYTAKFTVNFYRYNGGDLLKSQTVLYGNNATAPTATRTGYEFTGWSGAFTNVTSDLDVYGEWSVNSYTVTLNAAGGSNGTGSVTATYGSSMPSATMPTRTGYTFGGFYTGQNGGGTQYYTAGGASAKAWDIASATTLYAKWTGNQYTVTLDNNGGTGGLSSVTATYGSAMPAITLPTRTGYTFKGYYTTKVPSQGVQFYNSNGTSARAWNIADGRTLYAYWTPNTYAVTLDRQGGTGGTSSVTATYDAAMPAITVPSRTGFTFNGYYTAASGGGTRYYMSGGASAKAWDKTSATTLYAYWTGKTYNIRIDFGVSLTFRGSTGQIYTYPDKALAVGTYNGAVLAAPTRTGHTFLGYYDAASGGEMVYDANALAVDGTYWNGSYATSSTNTSFKGLPSSTATAMTVYARWSANTYTLTLNDAGGSGGSGSATVKYGEKPGAVAVPTREGYVFRGYYTGANGTGTRVYSPIGYAYSEWTTAGNATLYAYWLKTVRLTVSTACTDNDGVIPSVAGTPLVRINDGEPASTASADVMEGASVTVSAGNADGITLASFRSASWSGPIAPSADGTVEFVVPGADIEVTAYYDRNVVSASVYKGTGSASVAETVKIEPAETTRKVGDVVTFSAGTETSGQSFYGWGESADAPATPVSTSASYQVTLSGDIALYAHYAHDVTVTGGTGGSVAVSVLGSEVDTPTSAFQVPLGATMRVVSTADEGYHFTGMSFTPTGGSASQTPYGADATISPSANGAYAVAFSANPDDVYLACVDVAESGASGTVGATTAMYEGTETGVFAPVDESTVPSDVKEGVSNASWYKIRQGTTVRLFATKRSAPDAMEWKKSESEPLPLEVSPTKGAVMPNMEYTISRNVLVASEWGVYTSPKVTLVLATAGGRAVFKGEPPDQQGHDVHEKNFTPVQGVYQTTTIKAIPDPSGGYVFAGWYSGGILVSLAEEFTFEVRADAVFEAWFRLDDNAVFAWEGSKSNKTMEWKSGVMTMPRPGDPVAVRVDATGYPVDADVWTYSSPDEAAGRTHGVVVAQQDARRLPRMRPERFWQVSVTANVEVDALVVATNIMEAN